MDDIAWTPKQLERAWMELAKQNQITPEQAKQEYLQQASQAMTVDGEGYPIPDMATRRLAHRIWKGLPIHVDESIPPDEVRVVNSKTGEVVGKITNLKPAKGEVR